MDLTFSEEEEAFRQEVRAWIPEAMPADMNRMGFRDGIWICSFTEFKGL